MKMNKRHPHPWYVEWKQDGILNYDTFTSKKAASEHRDELLLRFRSEHDVSDIRAINLNTGKRF